MKKIDKHLIGKIVKVHLPKSNYPGAGVTVEKTYVVGECKFAGFNPILGTNQITVNRLPIYPVNPNQIEILN